MLFSDGNQQAVVSLSAEGDILTVDARGDVGSLHEELEIEPIPTSAGALFTARYLLEPLEHLNEKKARLDLVDSQRAAVYREKDFLALVLPVRRLSEA
jgi:DNA polymerase III sliding clamp (beta) subunit (PCNA family)